MTSTLAEAQVDLAPYVAAFERCVRAALAEYVEKYATVRHKHSRRTDASILHDLMASQFKSEFGAAGDKLGPVFVDTKGNLVQVVALQGKYKAKLKKLDAKLFTRNVPTVSSLKFVWQQTSFVEIPAATNIHIGYQLPTTEASFGASKVWVTCPNGDEVGWSWELDALQKAREASERAAAEVVQLPSAVPAKPKRGRVSLKSDAKSKKKGSTAEGADGG